MSNKTTMGRLLSTFKFERDAARKKAEDALWEKNGLGNPQKRQGYEIHEHMVHDREGNTLIVLELWQKIDESRVQISVNVESKDVEEPKVEEPKEEAKNVEASDEIKELMN